VPLRNYCGFGLIPIPTDEAAARTDESYHGCLEGLTSIFNA